MLVKITRLNHEITVTKHWPNGDLPKEPINALWTAVGTIGHDVAEQVIRDIYDKPQYVEIPLKNFSADKLCEFAKHFDFSVEDVGDTKAKNGDLSTEAKLKLYTVTVNVRFTARKPVKQYTALVLSACRAVAETQVLNALDLGAEERTGAIVVEEMEGPFVNGQILTLNSHR